MCCLRSCIYAWSCEGLSYHRTGSNRKMAFLGIPSAWAIMLRSSSPLPGFHLSLLPPEATQFVNILWEKCWKLTNKSSLKCLQLLHSLRGQPLTSLNSEFSLDSKVGSLLDVMLILECYEKFLKKLNWTTWLLRIHLPRAQRRPYTQSWLRSALGSCS